MYELYFCLITPKLKDNSLSQSNNRTSQPVILNEDDLDEQFVKGGGKGIQMLYSSYNWKEVKRSTKLQIVLF